MVVPLTRGCRLAYRNEGRAPLMGTALFTQFDFIAGVPGLDARGCLIRGEVPTLVATIEGGGLGGVDEARTWQKQTQGSRLMVLTGARDHLASTHAEQCASRRSISSGDVHDGL
jgi:hypothetical protein